MSIRWTINKGWLWEESSKPPAPVNPVMWIVNDKMSVPGMHVFVSSFPFANKHTQIMPCSLVENILDIVLTVIEKEQG